MKRLVALLAILAAGCSSELTSIDRSHLRSSTEMSFVPPSPVRAADAQRVAWDYFHTFFGDCGGVTFKSETDDAWRFSTVVGFGAVGGPNIVVMKSGDSVHAKGHATVYFVDGRWRFDASRYQTFFHNRDLEHASTKG